MSSPSSSSSGRRRAPDPEFLRVAFLHPDLGLGGAERLVVDAATELAARGHSVDVFTSHFDPGRCFDECRSGAFRVVVAGSWLPRSLLGGRFVALCALARCCCAAAALAWRARRPCPEGGVGGGVGVGLLQARGKYDVVIVDQVAGVVPFLRLLLALSAWFLPAPAPPAPLASLQARRRQQQQQQQKAGGGSAGGAGRRSGTPILFYCHFPDLLLSGGRASLLKRIYRAPLDALEQAATGAADACLVNSRFTAGVFADTFPRLARRGVRPGVLYPAAAIPPAQSLLEAAGAWPGELKMTPEQRAVVREAAAASAAMAAAGGAAIGGGGGGGNISGDGGLRSSLLLQRSHALRHRFHRGHRGDDDKQKLGGGINNGFGATAAANGGANGGQGGGAAEESDKDDLAAFLRGGPALLSINRFERKKGLALGLQALRRLLDDLEDEREERQARRARWRRQQQQKQDADDADDADDDDDDEEEAAADDSSSSPLPPPGAPRLVFAGGHDPRLPENVEHLRELMAEARRLGLWRHVRWLPSFGGRQRALLLQACRAVLYTPLGEHFGIVPLEAMASARPVVCLASGGPLESVVDGETGFLCDPPDAERVAAAWRVVMGGGEGGGNGGGNGGTGGGAAAPAAVAGMGLAARRHVEARFSRRAFGDALERELRALVEGRDA